MLFSFFHVIIKSSKNTVTPSIPLNSNSINFWNFEGAEEIPWLYLLYLYKPSWVPIVVGIFESSTNQLADMHQINLNWKIVPLPVYNRIDPQFLVANADLFLCEGLLSPCSLQKVSPHHFSSTLVLPEWL